MNNIFSYYEKQVVIPDEELDKKQRIQIINKQLKFLRDNLCETATSFDDLLMSQYAYVVSTLNIRNRIWPYQDDPMSFSRRIGELWESFCKASFYSSRRTRLVEFPNFEDVKHDLYSRKIPEQLWSLVGNVNLSVDSLFFSNKNLHAVDLKYSFNSNEKGNMQRLKTVGAVYKAWKPKMKLHVLVRDTENNESYLTHLSDFWDVRQGDDAYKEIKQLTGHDLKKWITGNINFKKHLDRDFYRNIQKKNLEKYLTW